jgi:hypothetical protein
MKTTDLFALWVGSGNRANGGYGLSKCQLSGLVLMAMIDPLRTFAEAVA